MAGKELQPPDDARYGTFHRPTKETKAKPATPQRTRFDSEMELRREYRGLERVRLVLALVLVFTLVAVSVLSEQERNEADRATRLRVATVASASVVSDLMRSVRVLYGPNASDVRAEFFAGAAMTPTQLKDAAAWATFNDSEQALGWSQLCVHATAGSLEPPEVTGTGDDGGRLERAMFAAGYAEGALTHRHMDEHYGHLLLTFFPMNAVVAAEQSTLHELRRFLQDNLDWMREQTRSVSARTQQQGDGDAQYWETLRAVLAQFDGLVAGYQAFCERETPLSALDLLMLNAQADLHDLVPAIRRRLQQQPAVDSAELAQHVSPESSVLLRILPDAQDLVWGHVTSHSGFVGRVSKRYDLPTLHRGSDKKPTERRQMSLSSSPGLLSSPDASYLTSAGLSVLETAHDAQDSTLLELVTPHSVLSWLRVSVANALAVDGTSWSEAFAKHDSGTHIGQWTLVDTHQFVPGRGFASGGLLVLDQRLGLVHVEDVSAMTNAQGYWASHSVNSECVRMFRRDAARMASYEALQSLLRSDDPQVEALGGAVDVKVTSLSRAQRLEWDVAIGVEHVGQRQRTDLHVEHVAPQSSAAHPKMRTRA